MRGANDFLLTLAVLLTCGAIPTAAQEESHPHIPVTIPSAPVISRLKVAFSAPHRVVVADTGDIYVADIRAGVVFRTTPTNVTSVVADGLQQPVGLRLTNSDEIIVLTAGNDRTAQGRIYKVNSSGERSLIAGGLTAPRDVLIDDAGNLTVALHQANRIVRIDPDGERTTLGRIDRPTALTRGPDGELFVASAAGVVSQLLPDGRVQTLAAGFNTPAGLSIAPDGRLLVVDSGSREIAAIEPERRRSLFARVPVGTVAVAFSREGNMVLANSHLQSVTRVTTRLSVPCPHCSGRIPVVLKRPAPAQTGF